PNEEWDARLPDRDQGPVIEFARPRVELGWHVGIPGLDPTRAVVDRSAGVGVSRRWVCKTGAAEARLLPPRPDRWSERTRVPTGRGAGPMATASETVRLAAVGDIHCGKSSQGAFQPLFARVAEAADVLLLCGDLTDYGLPEEAHILAKELTAVAPVP